MAISSSLFTGPLFSTIITICTLILLYFPSLFIGIVFSPVLISTSILLISLLRLGAIQKENKISDDDDRVPAKINDTLVVDADDWKRVPSKSGDVSVSQSGSWDNHDRYQVCGNASFVGWDVRAPLQVIHEGYEGSGDDSDDVSDEMREAHMATLDRCTSLSKFYPETDSESSASDEEYPVSRGWESSENIGFRWEREDRDGMIEIELDGEAFSETDEDDDNLIEIDLHPASIPATC